MAVTPANSHDSHEGESESPDALKIAEFLWAEYQYRHDMVWRLVFRLTAVATALVIAPFLVDRKTQELLGDWMVALPALAVFVICLGFLVLPPELGLLDSARTAYRYEKDRALGHLLACSAYEPQYKPPPERGSIRRLIGHFSNRVSAFLILLLMAAVAYLILFIIVWLDRI